jgi:hypothetical protein
MRVRLSQDGPSRSGRLWQSYDDYAFKTRLAGWGNSERAGDRQHVSIQGKMFHITRHAPSGFVEKVTPNTTFGPHWVNLEEGQGARYDG